MGVLAGSLKSYPLFWKARGNFWGNDLYDALVYERKFKSEYLERQIYEQLRVNLPSWSLSKLSTFNECSIVKFIENQSEHLSKLTLYRPKTRATRRSRRAREPSRIPLLFIRDLNKKNSMFGRNLSSKRFQRLRYRNLQSSIAMLIRWENFIMHDINVITNAIQR